MTDWPFPFWIAHRGAGKLAPENTLAAFREGARHGYRAFECDVKLSADGVPFLLHDGALDRTTDARGPADGRTWAELSQLDAGGWHSRAYAGEPPASLASIARFVIHNAFALDIEIKPVPGTELETGAAVAHAALDLWQGAKVGPLLSSFQPRALQAARDAAPLLPRALLLDTLRDGWLAEAQALGCTAVITAYPLMERAVVDALHAAGMRALVYTVNDPAAVSWLRSAGVDGIVTDAVDRFSAAD